MFALKIIHIHQAICEEKLKMGNFQEFETLKNQNQQAHEVYKNFVQTICMIISEE